MENLSEQAVSLFCNGKNCAQSVLMVFAEELGITQEMAFSIAAGFGGGIARNGEVCGAVSGAVMALGLKQGLAGKDPEQEKELTAISVNLFLDAFKESQGSIRCRDLIQGINLLTEEGRSQWNAQEMQEKACIPAVSEAVRILSDLQ